MKKIFLMFLVITFCDSVLAVTWSEIEPNLVLWYEFEDNCPNTTVLDSSGNGYHGTLISDDPFTNLHSVDGVVNNAILLGYLGNQEYINCNSEFAGNFGNGFSICLFVKLLFNTPEIDNDLFGVGSVGQDDGYIILRQKAGGKLYAKFSAGNDVLEIEEDYWNLLGETTQFDFIVMKGESLSQSETRISIYINSVLFASVQGTLQLSKWNINNLPPWNFYVGASNLSDVPSNFFYGVMDNFMLFNKALYNEELEVVYKKSKPNGYVLIGR